LHLSVIIIIMKNLLLVILLGLGASAALAQGAPTGTTHSGGKAAMCIGCHGIPGYKMAYPHVYHVPMIAGQNAKFIEAALNAYKSGERKHPTMGAIAGTLNDKDIAELAAYYAKGGSGK
jgi:cytochrome c553